MKITNKWLEKHEACSEGVEWFKSQKKTEANAVLLALMKDDKLDWANWTICRVFNKKKKIHYAIFAA